MCRKSIVMLLTGLSLGVVLSSGLFNEAEQAQMSKTGWVASTAK